MVYSADRLFSARGLELDCGRRKTGGLQGKVYRPSRRRTTLAEERSARGAGGRG
jgi:hypothetical protein